MFCLQREDRTWFPVPGVSAGGREQQVCGEGAGGAAAHRQGEQQGGGQQLEPGQQGRTLPHGGGGLPVLGPVLLRRKHGQLLHGHHPPGDNITLTTGTSCHDPDG